MIKCKHEKKITQWSPTTTFDDDVDEELHSRFVCTVVTRENYDSVLVVTYTAISINVVGRKSKRLYAKTAR